MKLYHTSPRPITHISQNGSYGDCLFFQLHKPWERNELPRQWVYEMELPDYDIMPVAEMSEDDVNAVELLASTLLVDKQQAVCLLSGVAEPADFFEERAVVRARCRAARDAGRTGVLLEDGVTYVASMSGIYNAPGGSKVLRLVD